MIAMGAQTVNLGGVTQNVNTSQTTGDSGSSNFATVLDSKIYANSSSEAKAVRTDTTQGKDNSQPTVELTEDEIKDISSLVEKAAQLIEDGDTAGITAILDQLVEYMQEKMNADLDSGDYIGAITYLVDILAGQMGIITQMPETQSEAINATMSIRNELATSDGTEGFTMSDNLTGNLNADTGGNAQLAAENSNMNEVVPQTAEEVPQQENDETLNKLIDYAKENLGLDESKLSVQTKPEVQQTTAQAVIPPSKVDKASEFNNILSAVAGQTESSATQTVFTENDTSAGQQSSESKSDTAQQETRQTDVPSEIVFVPQQIQQTEVQPLQNQQRFVSSTPIEQIVNRIFQNTDVSVPGTTSITMVLNPESLGRITLTVQTIENGHVAISIAAENRETQSLLGQRQDSLQSALSANGVNLERYEVVYTPDNRNLFNQNFDGSSKNPYGKPQEDENEDDGNSEFSDILATM